VNPIEYGWIEDNTGYKTIFTGARGIRRVHG
jgi:hypothetical protein